MDENEKNQAILENEIDNAINPDSTPPRNNEDGTGIDFVVPAKVHKEHKKLLDIGTHPRDIPHIAYGYMRGCQCISCKEKRGEMLEKKGAATVHNTANQDNLDTEIIKELLDSEATGIIADLPRTIAETAFSVKYPSLQVEIEKIWHRSEREQKVIDKISKKIAERYLSLPEMKHKELVIYGIFEGLKISLRSAQTIALIKMKGLGT
jgi:hypothetical protein